MTDTNDCFLPLPEQIASAFDRRARLPNPVVYRGLAAHWPAVRHWSFDHLAARVPDEPIHTVVGNREVSPTRFARSSLRRYLSHLAAREDLGSAPPYLKEFDLLRALPPLRADLHHAELLPATRVRSLRSWIGPRGARTGLHCDYLDNLAVQVIGSKRWWLARPGAVERRGAVSAKFDAWAVLANVDARALAVARGHCADEFYVVDLWPGDVLHVPAGWWHEVLNLSPSLLFGGFNGNVARVLPRWLQVSAMAALHRCGWRRGSCTCHETPGPLISERRARSISWARPPYSRS